MIETNLCELDLKETISCYFEIKTGIKAHGSIYNLWGVACGRNCKITRFMVFCLREGLLSGVNLSTASNRK